MAETSFDILSRIPTATVFEAAGRVGDMSPDIRPMVAGRRLAGPAFTVKTWLGDNRAVLRALAEAPAGSVLVIDNGGTPRSTAWGGTSSSVCRLRGLAGCVTNGAVRDLEIMREIGIPVYSAGISLRGAAKADPGHLGGTVSVGGVAVNPGDLVLGDEDGVLVVAAQRIDAVAKAAIAQKDKEDTRDRRIAAGDDLLSVFGIK